MTIEISFSRHPIPISVLFVFLNYINSTIVQIMNVNITGVFETHCDENCVITYLLLIILKVNSGTRINKDESNITCCTY